MIRSFFAVCAAVLLCAQLSSAQKGTKPVVSLNPFTSEQLSVYRAALAGWMPNDGPAMNLSIQTEPLQQTIGYDKDRCGKGLDLEAISESTVHRFRLQDLAQLGPEHTLTLVDPEKGSEEVRNNDPEQSMRKGKSVDEAVRNGFAHGLATLSEIQFDKSHTHAIVFYGFRCGGLCGNGATILLEKKDGAWKIKNHCSDWIS